MRSSTSSSFSLSSSSSLLCSPLFSFLCFSALVSLALSDFSSDSEYLPSDDSALLQELIADDDQHYADKRGDMPGVLRFGKRAQAFIRFGKRLSPVEKKEMPGVLRFGKRSEKKSVPGVLRFGKRSEMPGVLRFGKKSVPGVLRFGRK